MTIQSIENMLTKNDKQFEIEDEMKETENNVY
jgi:hypothetical protein